MGRLAEAVRETGAVLERRPTSDERGVRRAAVTGFFGSCVVLMLGVWLFMPADLGVPRPAGAVIVAVSILLLNVASCVCAVGAVAWYRRRHPK